MFRAAILLGLLQTVSCTKTDLLNFKWDRYAEATGYVPNCKLRSIVHAHLGTGYIVEGKFSYLPNGNLLSLSYGPTPGTGNPNHYFFYDQKNRLIEYRAAYSPDDPTESIRHRYGYNSKNQIIVDTLFNVTVSEEGEATYFPRIISTLTYDNQGRVAKEKESWQGEGEATNYYTYAYDSRGNLLVDGWNSAWYDNKVSFLRTHPIFTFLTRNYSKNNPLNPTATPARKYNSKKLPLSVNPGNDSFFGAVNLEKLTYDCN